MGLLLEKRTVIGDIGGVRIGQERYIGPESMLKIPWLYSPRSLQTVKRVRNAKSYNVTNLSPQGWITLLGVLFVSQWSCAYIKI